MTDTAFNNPHNPNYGNGTFRRRIRLVGEPGKVTAELEDCNHGFRSVVFHDGTQVTDVQAQALRVPLTTCGGAIEPLKALSGISIESPTLAINGIVSARANCTHLYDLSLLAIAHANRGNVTRQYDVEVEDEVDGRSESRVLRDGQLVFKWQTGQWQILAPKQLKDKSLFKGFAAWASKAFKGDEQEAAFVLQKGYFVAQSRIYDIEAFAGSPAINNTPMHNACYSYTSPRLEQAYSNTGAIRDFTDCPEQLLKFV